MGKSVELHDVSRSSIVCYQHFILIQWYLPSFNHNYKNNTVVCIHVIYEGLCLTYKFLTVSLFLFKDKTFIKSTVATAKTCALLSTPAVIATTFIPGISISGFSPSVLVKLPIIVTHDKLENSQERQLSSFICTFWGNSVHMLGYIGTVQCRSILMYPAARQHYSNSLMWPKSERANLMPYDFIF